MTTSRLTATAVLERARLVDLYDYVQLSMAAEHIHLLNLQFANHYASVAQIATLIAANLLVPGPHPLFPVPAPRFTVDDSQLLIAITAVNPERDHL